MYRKGVSGGDKKKSIKWLKFELYVFVIFIWIFDVKK